MNTSEDGFSIGLEIFLSKSISADSLSLGVFYVI